MIFKFIYGIQYRGSRLLMYVVFNFDDGVTSLGYCTLSPRVEFLTMEVTNTCWVH